MKKGGSRNYNYMKKSLLIFLILGILTVIDARSQDTIRVLAIGNSFSADAVENHLYELGRQEGVTFIIGNLYIGGCSLQRHWQNAQDDKPDYEYRKINATGKLRVTKQATLMKGITDERWDYVTFQQNSPNSGFLDTYFPYLDQLTAYVREHTTNPGVKLVFHQTWAYAWDSDHADFPRYNRDQKLMYRSIIKASTKAAAKAGIRYIIPSGTAIQNGRSSFIGDRFCRDGYHLKLDLGRYTAASTWFEFLTGRSVIGNGYAPTTLTPLEVITVQRAAHEAVARPFEVTTIRLSDRRWSSPSPTFAEDFPTWLRSNP